MFVADTHSDTLYAMGVHHLPQDRLMITPDKLRTGGVTLQTFALWTGPKGNQGDVRGIAEAEMSAVPVLRQAGLRQVDDPADAREGELCFMLSIEGGELFESGLGAVGKWRAAGVRMNALTWNHDNAIGHPAKNGSREGLTDYGVRVAKEMQRLGMAVDTSHLNEAGFYDLFRRTDRVPMASHSCVRSLCDHPRNLTDEQLRLLIREGGYVGINFYPFFLDADGHATIDTVVRHIDTVCQMGGAGIVGFGSDFDGIECVPEGLEDPSRVPALLDRLRALGYDEDTVAGIAGENLRRYYARVVNPGTASAGEAK